MWKDWARLGFSLVFAVALWGGVFFSRCTPAMGAFEARLGDSIGLVLIGYAFAVAFASIDLTLQYFRLFADGGTLSRRVMSRGRATGLIFGFAIFLLLAHLTALHVCR